MTAFAIYSPKGELLASFDAVEDATYAGRTRWAGQVGWIERRDGLVYRGPGPASVARKPPEPAPDRVTAPPVEPPVARPTPPPVAPRGACPQCGAVGALRREGRDLYCSQRCGYYLTPGQRRQAA